MNASSNPATGSPGQGPPAAGSYGIALVRRPGPRLAEGLVTHVERAAVDAELAASQHRAYCDALVGAGWRLHEVAPAEDHPDAVFVEDTVVVVDDLAVLTLPGAPQRQGEVDGTAAAVTALGLQVARIEGDSRLDGGDVLQVGRTVYVGVGDRTNTEGVEQLRHLVGTRGRDVVAVPLRAVLHLKSAVTALPDGTMIGLPDLDERVDPAALPRVHRVSEDGGAHVVPLGGDAVLVAASAPRTVDWLVGRGYDPVVVDIGEFEKLEGCVTCLCVQVWRGVT